MQAHKWKPRFQTNKVDSNFFGEISKQARVFFSSNNWARFVYDLYTNKIVSEQKTTVQVDSALIF